MVLGQHAVITESDLPPMVLAMEGAAPIFTGEVLPIRRMQRLYAQWALAQSGGLRGKTAEKLGVDAKTLAKWLSAATDED